MIMEQEIIYPRPLRAGDRVCLIDPANARTPEAVQKMTEYLEGKGFRVSVAEEMAFKRGSWKERAERLNQVLRDEENRALFCIWGGYGTMTLLEELDYEAFRRNRPVFVGFSDITALHAAIGQRSKAVTFHGPASFGRQRIMNEETLEYMLSLAMEPKKEREICNLNGTTFEVLAEEDEQSERKYACEGRLTGGNLTLVSRLMGTPYEIDTRGRILFLEEIGEKPYRLHGMLMQLRLAGKLAQAAGILIGSLRGCDIEGRPGSAMEAVRDVLGDLPVPVLFQVRAGHIEDTLTLPMNAKIRIEGNRIYQSL